MTYQQKGIYNKKVRNYRNVIFRNLLQIKLTSELTQTAQKDAPLVMRSVRCWRIYMFYLILLLSLITTLIIAYTMAMQKTTHSIGRLLMNKAAGEPGAGVQDAITPKSQTTRNLVMFILILVVFGLTTYQYAWYHGIWVVLACFLGSSLFGVILGLRPGYPRLVASVAKDMERRRQAYLNSNDTLRAAVIGELISKLEQLSPEAIRNEARR
jgi:hypothetical protein